jgi:hypothetical protein
LNRSFMVPKKSLLLNESMNDENFIWRNFILI